MLGIMGNIMVRITKSLVVLSAVSVLLILLSGCGLGSAQAGRKPSPDWSRGISLSSDVGGTVGMAVTGEVDAIHFVWPTALDDQAHVHYVQLNNEGDTNIDMDLALSEGRVRSPRLLLAGDGKLHLLWGKRVTGSKYWELWHALLDESGQLVGPATQVSQPDTKVGTFVVAQSNEGTGYVVWEEDLSRSLMGAAISDAGVGPQVQLVKEGAIPGIAADEDGSLHMAWFEPLAVRYVKLEYDNLETVQGDVVVNLEDLTGNTIDGPAIDLADGQVYVVWSTFANVGLESGSGWTEYVSFPADSPAASASSRLWLLPNEEQPYQTYNGGYKLTVLADPVTSPMLTTNIILEPGAGGPRGSELAMIVSAKQEKRLDEYVQMVLVLFEDGQFKGYQLAGKTESLSREGSLLTDGTGNLHLAWREGTGTKVYYATTEPNIRSGIDRLGGDDLASVLLGGGLDAVTGALFFPLALFWFMPGFLLLGIWKIKREDETMSDKVSQFLVVIAIITYQLSKALFMPTIISYIPFSAWLDIPEEMKVLVQVLVPAVILISGIAAAEIARRRNPTTSGLIYFLIACGVDALLTLGIYGVGYLGYL